MSKNFKLPAELSDEIDTIMVELRSKAKIEASLLADVTGQLIHIAGRTSEFDPVLIAALAAGDMAAMSELGRQIGEESGRSILHEGKHRHLYLFGVADSFVLIIIFKKDTPIGLVRLFASRAVAKLDKLVDQFEDWAGDQAQLQGDDPEQTLTADFGDSLAQELDKAFGDW
jgi:predicted regulator of Ras-like GTPase activity (Roadblock/LC7/MglB family)